MKLSKKEQVAIIKVADKFFSQSKIFIPQTIDVELEKISGYEFKKNKSLSGILIFGKYPFDGNEYKVEDVLHYSETVFSMENKVQGRGFIKDGNFFYEKEHPTKKALLVMGTTPRTTNIQLS